MVSVLCVPVRQRFLFLCQFSAGSLYISLDFENRPANLSPEMLDSPFYLFYNYVHEREGTGEFSTWFRNADEMAGTRRIGQNERLQQYFVCLISNLDFR